MKALQPKTSRNTSIVKPSWDSWLGIRKQVTHHEELWRVSVRRYCKDLL